MTMLKTCTIEQAMAHIQALPIDKQQSIFDYIDLMMLQYRYHQENHQPQTLVDLIHQYPKPTSFNADNAVTMQRAWRDEWE